jgi:hypothetical protein
MINDHYGDLTDTEVDEETEDEDELHSDFEDFKLYDNEITSLIDIYFLRISFTPSKPFRHPV